jgi:hypothetical protein
LPEGEVGPALREVMARLTEAKVARAMTTPRDFMSVGGLFTNLSATSAANAENATVETAANVWT